MNNFFDIQPTHVNRRMTYTHIIWRFSNQHGVVLRSTMHGRPETLTYAPVEWTSPAQGLLWWWASSNGAEQMILDKRDVQALMALIENQRSLEPVAAAEEIW